MRRTTQTGGEAAASLWTTHAGPRPPAPPRRAPPDRAPSHRRRRTGPAQSRQPAGPHTVGVDRRGSERAPGRLPPSRPRPPTLPRRTRTAGAGPGRVWDGPGWASAHPPAACVTGEPLSCTLRARKRPRAPRAPRTPETHPFKEGSRSQFRGGLVSPPPPPCTPSGARPSPARVLHGRAVARRTAPALGRQGV